MGSGQYLIAAARISMSGTTSEKSSVWDPETDGRSLGDDFPEELLDGEESSRDPGMHCAIPVREILTFQKTVS